MSLFNRTEVIDKNFTRFVHSEKFPKEKNKILLNKTDEKKVDLVSIFESQITSRHMDIAARSLKDKGECFYTIGSSGHEGNAVFGKVFPYKDIAFLHYRSAPFFLERSKQLAHSTPIYDMALSFVASSDDPISGGRHKVIGSHELNIPPQTSTIASHIPKAVGTAFSIDRARDLNILERSLIDDSIVLCSFGDASANHATALAAFNTACLVSTQGGHIPIIFICEDNGTGISVPTDGNWIERNFSNRYGMNYIKTDGMHLIDLLIKAKKAERICRLNRVPVFLHMKTIRLMGHAGSDIEVGYRSINEIENDEFNESKHARLIADHYDCNHQEIESSNINPSMFEQLSEYYDDPIFDTSMIPTFLLSNAVSKFSKVAIGGDGGDELFGGYPHYNKFFKMHRKYSFIPHLLRSRMSNFLQSFLPIGMRGKKTLEFFGVDFNNYYPNIAEFFNFGEIKRIFNASINLSNQSENLLLNPIIPINAAMISTISSCL